MEQEFHRRFSARMDEWLDAGHGACVFGNCARYIRGNPGKAGLRAGEFTVYESEMLKGV